MLAFVRDELPFEFEDCITLANSRQVFWASSREQQTLWFRSGRPESLAQDHYCKHIQGILDWFCCWKSLFESSGIAHYIYCYRKSAHCCMNTAINTNYIVSEIPSSHVEEFISFMLDFREKTGCRFRFKADGRTSKPMIDFPSTFWLHTWLIPTSLIAPIPPMLRLDLFWSTPWNPWGRSSGTRPSWFSRSNWLGGNGSPMWRPGRTCCWAWRRNALVPQTSLYR